MILRTDRCSTHNVISGLTCQVDRQIDCIYIWDCGGKDKFMFIFSPSFPLSYMTDEVLLSCTPAACSGRNQFIYWNLTCTHRKLQASDKVGHCLQKPMLLWMNVSYYSVTLPYHLHGKPKIPTFAHPLYRPSEWEIPPEKGLGTIWVKPCGLANTDFDAFSQLEIFLR